MLMAFRTLVWQDSNGNRNVPYLNWNDGRWYLNFNWLENDWNSNDRLLRSRKSLCSLPIFWGEFIFQHFLSNYPAFYRFQPILLIKEYIFCYLALLFPI